MSDPFEVAKDFIRPYVKRGDSYDWLVSTHMAFGCRGLHISISGDVNGKRLDGHHVVISELDGEKCQIVFSLRRLFDAISSGAEQLSLF